MIRPLAGKPGGSRLRLLVVDDSGAMRILLAELLGQEGYEVEVAASAEEALQLTSLIRWDGLVLDVDLPDLDGVELYARILKNTGGRRLPVIFFTGRPNQALLLGLDHVPWAKLVAKPCNSRELLAALEECLRTDVEAGPAAGG